MEFLVNFFGLKLLTLIMASIMLLISWFLFVKLVAMVKRGPTITSQHDEELGILHEFSWYMTITMLKIGCFGTVVIAILSVMIVFSR